MPMKQEAHAIHGWEDVTTTQGQLRSSQGGVSLGGYTTGEVLAIYDVVYIKPDGKIWKANAVTITKMLAVGMVLEAHGAGDTNVFVHALGLVTNAGWGWTPGDKLYISVTVDGGMQAAVPAATGMSHRSSQSPYQRLK